MANQGQDIQVAIDLLSAGKLVAIPTETVYGLAANALNSDAVVRIFEAKNRPRFNPLIVHIAGLGEMSKYVESLPEAALKLAEAFWPGPLTLLLPRKNTIPDLVTADSPHVAIRVPRHPLTLALLEVLDFPLAAPSANPFGYISPTSAAHVQQQLGHKVDYILDGGHAEVGLESTIVGFDDEGNPVLYRLGGLSLEAIEAVAGTVTDGRNLSAKPAASGMLKSHYAPDTALYLGPVEENLEKLYGKKIGALVFQHLIPGIPEAWQRVLSPTGDLAEAAKRLFTCLHELDALELDAVISSEVPEQGLGRAINDRLRRAQAIFKTPY